MQIPLITIQIETLKAINQRLAGLDLARHELTKQIAALQVAQAYQQGKLQGIISAFKKIQATPFFDNSNSAPLEGDEEELEEELGEPDNPFGLN